MLIPMLTARSRIAATLGRALFAPHVILLGLVGAFASGGCAARAVAPTPVTDRLLVKSTLPIPVTFERVLARTRSLAYVVEEIDARRGYLRVVAHHRDTEGSVWGYRGTWGSPLATAPRLPGHFHVQIYRDGSLTVLAACAHVADGKEIPVEFFEELVTYAKELQVAVTASR